MGMNLFKKFRFLYLEENNLIIRVLFNIVENF